MDELEIYTVQSLHHCFLSGEVWNENHGAHTNRDMAIQEARTVYAQMKEAYEADIAKYSDENLYPDADSGKVMFFDDAEIGHFGFVFGKGTGREQNHFVSVDAWSVTTEPKKHLAVLSIDATEFDEYQSLLSARDGDPILMDLPTDTIIAAWMVEFHNGYTADVRVSTCLERGIAPWCEMILFDRQHQEVGCTDVRNQLDGVWSLHDSKTEYIVTVKKEETNKRKTLEALFK